MQNIDISSWSSEAKQAVKELSESTGWSASAVAGFLIQLGAVTLASNQKQGVVDSSPMKRIGVATFSAKLWERHPALKTFLPRLMDTR